MYSNDQTQIRQGFVNYIGAIIKTSPFEGRAARQNAASILIEEALKLAQNEDKTMDIYVLKPLIRGMVLVLKQRHAELSQLPSREAKEKAKDYLRISEELEILIKSIS